MFTKKSIFQLFSILVVVLMMSSTASARPLDAALGTGFTYQGRLTDGGLPANGTYDLQFKLYDALSGGTQVGSTVTIDDVTVTTGLFTVQLDFGNVFNGTALYLETGVRPGASLGAYTPLVPLQQLSATPYAIYASNAPWSGLTGVPAGFADGVDDNTTYTAGDGLELVGTQFKGKGTSYQNVVIVAKSGGDFTTITAALDSITDASASNPYLIYVAPGMYNEHVTMKQYVDIEGAGELTTKITSAGFAAADTGTVVGANNAELRFLTVENTGGPGLYPIAIYDNSASPRLTHITASTLGGAHNYSVLNYNYSSPTMTHVTASASGGVNSNNGVYNRNYSSPKMTDVTASGSGGTNSYGVRSEVGSTPVMTDINASASGGTFASYGVLNDNASLMTMTNVIASASGATNNYGVYIVTGTTKMINITASASGGTNSYGMYNDNASLTINNSVIGASGGTNNIGIYNHGFGLSVLVNNSQISGSTSTISGSGSPTSVGASQLNGGAVVGTVTCAGVYDENYTFNASTCP